MRTRGEKSNSCSYLHDKASGLGTRRNHYIIERKLIRNTGKISDIEIGAGAPKIIVPIVVSTKEDIM